LVNFKNVKTMKKYIVFILGILFCSGSISAQNNSDSIVKSDDQVKTLFSISNIKSHGVYVGSGIGLGVIGSNEYFEQHFTMAWVINHTFALGIEMSSFTADQQFSFSSNGEFSSDAELEGKMGGFKFTPIFFSKKLVHFTIPIMIGLGNVNAYEYITKSNNTKYVRGTDSDNFIVLKPAIEAEVNLYKHIRLGVHVQYQYALGLDLDYNGKDNKTAMNGIAGGLTLKFGVF